MRVRALLVASLAGLLLAPAAPASRSHSVRLAIVALPKSALGSAGRPLKLSPDSGVVSNADASSSITANPDTFSKLGRVTGYALIYGDAYSGRPGVTQISTGVDQYKTAGGAKRGLAFSKQDDPKITVLEAYGLPVAVKALKAANVGTRRFAEGVVITVPNSAPIASVDEQFTEGRYVLKVDVAAGSLSAAGGVAAKLARTLDHRLRRAEAGRLRGKPVKVPQPLKAGPPAGDPDLATLALTTSDFGGQATIAAHGYEGPPFPSLSEYDLDMEPAGDFDDLTQGIEWYPTANDATVASRFEGVVIAYVFASGIFTGTPGQFTPVDVSAVGDNAYGGIVSVKQTGQPTFYLAIVTLSASQAADFVIAGGLSQIQPSQVVDLAQTVANRLSVGLSG